MSLARWIDFGAISDDRGALVAIEGGRSVPFEIKRVYYLHSLSSNLPRGKHAHKALRQVAVCVAGRCQMLLDDGNGPERVILDTPNRGLMIEPLIWHEMSDFSPDCVLLVLASEHFDESDYIRDLQEFLDEARTQAL